MDTKYVNRSCIKAEKKEEISLFHCLFSAFIKPRSRENSKNLHGGNESTK